MNRFNWSFSTPDGRTNRLRDTMATPRTVIALLVAIVAVSAAAPEAAASRPVVVSVPDSVGQGQMLTVHLSGRGAADWEVEMTLPDGVQTAAPAWTAAVHPASGRREWVALLGVASTAATGPARIVAYERRPDGPAARRAARTVRIVAREFRDERIVLTSALSDLRSSDDPRKAEQSRVLWTLLTTPDATARFHTGTFQLPVARFRRTSFFGDRREFVYVDGEVARSIHNGWDFAAATGTPVVAPGSGRVVMARDRILTGNTIVIEHLPGVFTVYFHLDSLAVAEGDIVQPGGALGTIGSTGLSTGPHLHWEMRVAGAAVDPEPFLTEPLVDTAAVTGALSTVP